MEDREKSGRRSGGDKVRGIAAKRGDIFEILSWFEAAAGDDFAIEARRVLLRLHRAERVAQLRDMSVLLLSITQENRLLWKGAEWLIPFLALVFLAGKLVTIWITMRFRKALTPLIPLVDGRLGCNGLHGQLFGTFHGKVISAQVVTDARSTLFRGHPNARRHLLTIEFAGPSGRNDWKIYRDQLRVKGVDPEEEAELASRMVIAGARRVIQSLQTEVVVYYHANRNVLVLQEDIKPALAPSTARFQQQLAALDKLSEIAAAAELNSR